jgi:hypothetical protein
MVNRVKKAIMAGRKVKIFTARAGDPKQVARIQAWCIKQGLGRLEVTNVKDTGCDEIWDNIAKHVIPNSGVIRDS